MVDKIDTSIIYTDIILDTNKAELLTVWQHTFETRTKIKLKDKNLEEILNEFKAFKNSLCSRIGKFFKLRSRYFLCKREN